MFVSYKQAKVMHMFIDDSVFLLIFLCGVKMGLNATVATIMIITT